MINSNYFMSPEMFYSLVMFFSLGCFIYLGKKWKIPKHFILLHSTIVGWSGLMYLFIAYQTSIADLARYFDWVVSTPLLLMALYFTAILNKKGNYSLMLSLLILQPIVILTGLFADFLGDLRYFYLGLFLLAIIIKIIWVDLYKLAVNKKKYDFLLKYFTIQWLLYPLVFILYPLNFISLETYNFLFVILPIFSKAVFGFIDLYLLK